MKTVEDIFWHRHAKNNFPIPKYFIKILAHMRIRSDSERKFDVHSVINGWTLAQETA